MEIDNATDRIDQTPVRDHREVEHRAKRALLRENRHLGAGEMEHARVLRSQRTSWIPQRPDTRQRDGLLLGSSCSVSDLLDAVGTRGIYSPGATLKQRGRGVRDVSDGIETRSSLKYKVRLGLVYIRAETNTPEPAWSGQAA